ncbi:MAG: hypothetical protein QM747_20810 [Nocardioides sp.]
MGGGAGGYGGGMGAVLVPVVAVVIVLLVAAVAVKRFGRAEREHSDQLQAADRPTVRYEVPPGQDPAAVLADLRTAGYDVSADSEPGPSSPILIIGTASGGAPDRERLRTLLATASVNVDPSVDSDTELSRSSVRFLDE